MKLSLITEVGPSRRDFLKQTSRGIAAASGMPMLGPLAGSGGVSGAISSTFSNMSDEELMQTPEEDWIDKVPFARVVRIIKSPFNDDYAGNELVTKLMKSMTYGADYKNSGKVAQILASASKSAGKDIFSGGFIEALEQNLESMVELHDLWDKPAELQKFISNFSRTAKKIGVELPYDDMKKISNDYVKELENDLELGRELESERSKESEEPETYTPRPDDYIYGSSMHQPFESKLHKVLSKLIV